jgi:hypothetical protein
MAYIPTFAETQQALLEPRQEQQSGIVPLSSYSGGGVFQSTPTPEKVETPTPTQSQAVSPTQRATQQATTNVTGNVFQPITQQTQQLGQQLGQTTQKFYQEAGPSRTYQGIGGEQTLSQAIGGTSDLQNQAKRMEEAKGLVNATYSGPTQLGQEDVSTIQKGLQEAQGTAGALKSSAGVYSLLQKYAPGLTPGELQYETRLAQQNPEFKQQTRQYQKQTADLQTQEAQAEKQATEYGQQRTQQEQDISTQAKNYLTGQQTAINQQLQDVISQKTSQDTAAQAAYQQFLKTGSQEDWAKIPKEFLGTYTPETAPGQYAEPKQITAQTFQTPARQQLAAAEKDYKQVMDAYTDVKDLPLVELRIDGQGRETWAFPDASGWGANLDPKVRQRVIDRQISLQNAGFSPGSQREQTQSGKYATYMPLYFAEGGPENAKWTPADLRNYTVWHPGVSPSRQNVSTENQRSIYNNISDLIDMADKLEAAGEPWKAAQVGADVNRFISDEESVLSQRGEALSSSAKDWTKLVNKARKQYNKSTGVWSQVAGVIGNVASLGGALPPAVGGALLGMATGGLGLGAALGGAASPAAMPMISGPALGSLVGGGIGQLAANIETRPLGEKKQTKTTVKSAY